MNPKNRLWKGGFLPICHSALSPSIKHFVIWLLFEFDHRLNYADNLFWVVCIASLCWQLCCVCDVALFVAMWAQISRSIRESDNRFAGSGLWERRSWADSRGQTMGEVTCVGLHFSQDVTFIFCICADCSLIVRSAGARSPNLVLSRVWFLFVFLFSSLHTYQHRW